MHVRGPLIPAQRVVMFVSGGATDYAGAKGMHDTDRTKIVIQLFLA